MEQALTFALNSLHQGCYDEAAQFCVEVLQGNPENDRALHVLGVIAIQQGRLSEAVDYFRKAAAIKPADGGHHLSLATAQRALGNTEEAAQSYRMAAEAHPDRKATWEGWAYAAMQGEHYRDLLREFHTWLQPAVYLEIGIESGRTLALARPPTTAIGIDPKPKLLYTFDANTEVFETTSDEFFSAHDVRDRFGPIDLAFVDGLHLFEQTLRDFVHVEQQAAPNGVVLIHDCLPLHPLVTTRKRQTEFWTGDTWKLIPILKQFRPDLKVMTIATAPTGLGVVTCLDPESTVLEDFRDEIVDQWLDRELPEDDDVRRTELCVVDSHFPSVKKRIENALT